MLARHLIQDAGSWGARRIWLDAQSHAERFYRQLGFVPCSGHFCQWGIDVSHVTMELAILAS
jgi:predicted GNAT family N-acyltransferase